MFKKSISTSIIFIILLSGCSNYQKWESADVTKLFSNAGLEVDSPRPMTKDDYGLGPYVSIEGTRFLIPSLCEDCGGRIISFSSPEDLELSKAYYVELGKSSAIFFSWVFTKDNILVQINGDLSEGYANQYQNILFTISNSDISSDNIKPSVNSEIEEPVNDNTVPPSPIIINTSPPTNTPRPTSTPRPTNTPSPTLPPTEIPDPIIYFGTGDSILDAENPFGAAIVHIIGNTNSRYFAVKNYGEGNEQYDLLVNTTDSYDGIVPLDFKDDEKTVRFEITANGDWSIEIFPLASAPLVEIPGSIENTGDYVFRISGSPDTATITGNTESHYFSVHGWSLSGRDLLVNTTDVYSGTVLLDSNTIVIVVNSEGSWTVQIND